MQREKLPLGRQLMLQLIAFLILISVMCPVVWVISMSLDPRNIDRPSTLFNGISFEGYKKVLCLPPYGGGLLDFTIGSCSSMPNGVPFNRLLINSLFLAIASSAISIALAVTAAYAFSRFRFRLRKPGLFGFQLVLMLPAIGTIVPLFILLNGVLGPQLRQTLIAVVIAVIAGQLPFAIWNIKGFIDTIPVDLEEAAFIDGATRAQTFLRVMLPLAVPVIAVTALFGFIGGWTEYVLSWQFLGANKDQFTLAMTMAGMVGQFNTPWQQYAAMALLVTLPPSILFLFLQRYVVGGLTVGGVKG